MPAVAEIVHRLWERLRAGTRPATTLLCVGGDGSVVTRDIGICTTVLDCVCHFHVVYFNHEQ